MATTQRKQTAMDAGETREALASSLAIWIAAGFWPEFRARGFRVATGRLARRIGRTYDAVYADLLADAQLIANAE